MQSLDRAVQILNIFEDDSRCLRLNEIVQRTGLSKTTAHRLCSGLVKGNLLARVGDSKYKLAIRPLGKKRYRIGYGIQNASEKFSQQVTASIERSAAVADIELLTLDNQDSGKRSLENADIFLRERVDLVIESQIEIAYATRIAERMKSAHIPTIALEIPQPNAVFFGANNVEAGLMAGRYLAQWAQTHWNGEMEQVLLLDLPKAGQIPNARIQGSLLGMLERVVWIAPGQIKTLHTIGTLESAHSVVRRHLAHTSAKRILIAAINDPTGLGALQAFRDNGCEERCAIVCHNSGEESTREILNPKSALVGAVTYLPERYGDSVIPLALRMLSGQFVPRLNFTDHELLSP
jgi:ribose transport system substrate-binding protein